MGRLNGMSSQACASSRPDGSCITYQQVAGASYNTAGQISSLGYFGFNETRQYNGLNQLTRMTTTAAGGTVMDMQYNYTAGQNNGRITQSIDGVTGENVTYAYDALNRLVNATTATWAQSYSYDGFGNPSGVGYDASTNRPMGATYDANGLLIGSASFPNTWDVENRLVGIPFPATQFTYDPRGKRVMRDTGQHGQYGAQFEMYFYSITGQKLGTYLCEWNYPSGYTPCSQESTNAYFGGKLIQSQGVTVATDRLGSVRGNANGERMAYYPYGQERTTTADGREKFGGYLRDGPGQDYADQRYYNQQGAFWTPDPLATGISASNFQPGLGAVNLRSPLSWNRYVYAMDDPINMIDPSGLCYYENGSYWDDDDPGSCLNKNGSVEVGTSPVTVIEQFDSLQLVQINADPDAARLAQFTNYLNQALNQQLGEAASIGLWTYAGAAFSGIVGAIAEFSSGASTFFEGTTLSDSVLEKMATDAANGGGFHSFPGSVGAFEDAGTITKIVGGDGNPYIRLDINGSYLGKTGTFEFIKDSNGTITHWFFNPGQ
jgi:RHS repeat-associated protein